ncbi:unnamed protein product [Bursaphelenchus xylophilus]|uniref:(pine wood nematode) hypothetical protein n=1 Tax=Bursaphelenchus xylophilus TaxID=6326 RepID=A0A1I7SBK1_BURXY|nr:unnamed protein product [Bursaphelenchus xylophilus]CAG9114401.1 unnamed protein product [Bursaphelenchus xylophilus]
MSDEENDELDPYVKFRMQQLEAPEEGTAHDEFDIREENAIRMVGGQRKDLFYATSHANKKNLEQRRRGVIKKSRFEDHELDNADDVIEAGELYHDMKMIDDKNVVVKNFNGQFNLIDSFNDMELDKKLDDNVKKRYKAPSTIQRYAYPLIRETDRNLICRAPTGSGKTAAFLIPLIQSIIEIKKKDGTITNYQNPYAIILCHTRELALQLAKDAAIFTRGTPVGITFLIGEVMEDLRDREAKVGADIIIGTPGKLERTFFQDRNGGRFSLSKTAYFIADEADRLAGEYTFRSIVVRFRREILKATHGKSRLFMFSATSEEERDEVLAPNAVILEVGDATMPVLSVVQKFVEVRKSGFRYAEEEFINRKPELYHPRDLLHAILRRRSKLVDGVPRVDKTLVFVSKRRQADALAINLMQNGYLAISTNGSIPMNVRNETIESFKKGEIDIIVCTNVLARGINLPNVSLVINYNLPQAGLVYPTEYIHRLGRTGRMGNAGAAISFFDREKDKDIAGFLKKHLLQCNQPVPQFIEDTLNNGFDEFEANWRRILRKKCEADPDYVVPHKSIAEADQINFI